jgi:hypothetical protein
MFVIFAKDEKQIPAGSRQGPHTIRKEGEWVRDDNRAMVICKQGWQQSR